MKKLLNMKKILMIGMTFLMLLSVIGCEKSTAIKQKDYDAGYKYDIEYVFPDATFISVIEGEQVPTEIIVGFGGESGYEQFSTSDPDMINEYIEAFRSVHIEEEIDDEDEMRFIFDGIIDYTFVLEDDVRVTLGTDLSEYVTDRERWIQFHLGDIDQLIDLNARIRNRVSN